MDNIITISNKLFKTTKETVNPKFSKSWWNDECEETVKARRHRKNVFHKHPTVTNLIELRKAEARVKRVTKKAKKESLIKFTSTLTKDSPDSLIWRYIGKLNNRTKRTYSQPLISTNEIITDPKKKANIIAQHYYSIFNYLPLPIIIFSCRCLWLS